MARSRDEQRRQPSWIQTSIWENAVNPKDLSGEPSSSPAQAEDEAPTGTGIRLLEQALSPDKMETACKKVMENDGVPGVDGMVTAELRDYLDQHGQRLKQELLEETYTPQPVRRVEIPKRGGKGKRKLGIPTVIDRLVQQLLLQALTPVFDPHFSESSYGFRPGRSGHDAVRQSRDYVQDGYTWTVDVDLDSFFDRVNHDMLMARVARKVDDKRTLRLIRKYLNAGVMANGVAIRTEEGTPQGGPLSPLLANILLDDCDKELEKRGHRFCRYADDLQVYVRSKRAGERVMTNLSRFLETTLKLKVNREKSAVEEAWKRTFLGFSFYWRRGELHIRIDPDRLERCKDRLRELTNRRESIPMRERIRSINQYLTGWLGYFALADCKTALSKLFSLVRRRLVACLWVKWPTVRSRRRHLIGLGVDPASATALASSRKGPTRMSPLLRGRAFTDAYWESRGLHDPVKRYQDIRRSWRTA